MMKGFAKKSYSAMANRIDNKAITSDIAAIFEKQLKPYVTKNLLKETMLANELKYIKEMSVNKQHSSKEMTANMYKYNDLVNTAQQAMFWKFLSTVGGCAVLLLGIGNYAIDKLDEKIDKTKEEIKNDIQKLDQKIDNLEKKIDRILERGTK